MRRIWREVASCGVVKTMRKPPVAVSMRAHVGGFAAVRVRRSLSGSLAGTASWNVSPRVRVMASATAPNVGRRFTSRTSSVMARGVAFTDGSLASWRSRTVARRT